MNRYLCLRIIAVVISIALITTSIVAHIGFAPPTNAQITKMMGEMVLASAIGLIVWLLANILENKNKK